ILDTESELDIRKLESLGLSSQEERVPWIFFATFSNQLQQLAKHVLRKDYIFFYASANVDVAHTMKGVPIYKETRSERCLIFVETQRSADTIGALFLQKSFMSITFHENQTHQQ
ncbi:unnamed protein product, partial [Rotaria sp. Silwood1]